MRVSGGIEWVMVVNLIIWTGLFLYLRRLDRRLDHAVRSLGSLPSLDIAQEPARHLGTSGTSGTSGPSEPSRLETTP